MINILLGFLIIVAVILAIWSIQIKRKHGGGCGGCPCPGFDPGCSDRRSTRCAR
ncbi:MAG: FeoB-associated Cys-rich membrane protein, partial [Neisseriaceae bacterium]|nr:FeoB-associated Cys-rich membrane protein [Neisseriaceae bacterium]